MQHLPATALSPLTSAGLLSAAYVTYICSARHPTVSLFSRHALSFRARQRRASDKCQREKRKTINGDDLLWAMSTLGFEEYVEPLKLYLSKYREVPRRALLALASAVLAPNIPHSLHTDQRAARQFDVGCSPERVACCPLLGRPSRPRWLSL